MSKPPRNSANDPADDTSNSPTAMPILVALGIVGVVLVVMVLLRMIGGEDVSAEGAVGRAVVGQNDALQREDYADFRRYTCAERHGSEAEVIGEQRESSEARGARFVDDVADVAVDGGRATATVVYHFEGSADQKLPTPMTFVLEGGEWTVCSAGPR